MEAYFDIFLKYEHGWSSEKKLNHALHWNCQHYLKHQLIVDYLKAYQSDGHNVTDRNDNLLNLLNKHFLARKPLRNHNEKSQFVGWPLLIELKTKKD